LINDGPLENSIKDKVNEMGLSDAVQFLGTRGDVNDLMQAMDVFVLPSLLPVVGVEAQAAGLQCILSDKITVETKILEKTIFIPLTDSSKIWAQTILGKYKTDNRDDIMKEFIKKII
jgi:glycosyltransferase EpsF